MYNRSENKGIKGYRLLKLNSLSCAEGALMSFAHSESPKPTPYESTLVVVSTVGIVKPSLAKTICSRYVRVADTIA